MELAYDCVADNEWDGEIPEDVVNEFNEAVDTCDADVVICEALHCSVTSPAVVDMV